MLLISHRGNINGTDSDNENTISYLKTALRNNFLVETDIIYYKQKYYFGHCRDSIKEEICLDFLNENLDKMLLHCKDIESLNFIKSFNKFNYFFHERESYALTSFKWLISHSSNYEEKLDIKDTIIMLPEKFGLSKIALNNCSGICSDIISFYD